MKRVNELYNFDKFWKVYTRQNRCVSKWDERRTDMDIFINRTLGAWFVGKFYQVEVERRSKIPGAFLPDYKLPTIYKIFTKYIYITNFRFAFAPYHDLIEINYIEPHSEKIEQVSFGLNEFMNLKIMQNEADFRLLKKFYPIRDEEIKLPILPFVEFPIKPKKVKANQK